MPTQTTDVRLAEVMGALSLATDLGMGQPMEFGLQACVLAVRLGDALGLSEAELRDIYYYALLRYIGCTAESHVLAAFFGDEIALRRDFALVDMGNMPELFSVIFRYIRQANADKTLLQTMQSVTQGMLTARSVSQNEFAGHCQVAQRLAGRMGFSEGLLRSLGQLYERWDGRGLPYGLSGEAVELPVRVVVFAQDMVIFHRIDGVDGALSIARKRRGGAYDPRLVEAFVPQATHLLSGIGEASSWETLLEYEPGRRAFLSNAELDTVCAAIADFADLKSPYTLSHSARVSDLAADAAGRFGLPDPDIANVRRAGWLHEIGRAGISAGIWTKTGPLSSLEREQIRLHTYYTERVLAQALNTIGTIASMHHERLDGSGYHRGATAASLSPAARILAAANVYQAHLEPRPHRPASAPEEAEQFVLQEARAGRLDRDAVNAVLVAAGHSVRGGRPKTVSDLSEREVEVLRLMARGHSMKQIAGQLFISPKTVDNHIQHIYEKIGVSTRAAATLFAVEQNLLLDTE
jgi:HD-GYP domain-containing protein (c-di-GMP phosphodiesterase class II)